MKSKAVQYFCQQFYEIKLYWNFVNECMKAKQYFVNYFGDKAVLEFCQWMHESYAVLLSTIFEIKLYRNFVN